MFEALLALRPGLSPAEHQRFVRREFPAVVLKSSLHLWRPGDPIALSPQRLLVGAATYAFQDLRLLDRIDSYARNHVHSLRVDVFNTLDVSSHADFARYIPGLGEVYHTPVAGLWEVGRFVTGGSGRNAIELIQWLIVGKQQ